MNYSITINLDHNLYSFLCFMALLKELREPNSIRVGLPWGQFQGLAKEERVQTYFFICSFLNGSPTFTAERQAIEAHIEVNFWILCNSLF